MTAVELEKIILYFSHGNGDELTFKVWTQLSSDLRFKILRWAHHASIKAKQ
jgi:hypothetical protein